MMPPQLLALFFFYLDSDLFLFCIFWGRGIVPCCFRWETCCAIVMFDCVYDFGGEAAG